MKREHPMPMVAPAAKDAEVMSDEVAHDANDVDAFDMRRSSCCAINSLHVTPCKCNV